VISHHDPELIYRCTTRRQIHMSNTESDPDDHNDHDDPDDDEASSDEEKTTVRTGRNFEQTYRLSAAEAGEFLIAVGEQLRDSDELTITDEEWELPFAFGEPVEVELDFDGMDDPELELEVELPGRPDDSAPRVE
jgi:amphi-Trp domain-containing protein